DKAPSRQPLQGKANAIGNQTTKRRTGKQRSQNKNPPHGGNQKPRVPQKHDLTCMAKSHYMNQTFTYWSFLKNRPTIQTNPHREPAKQPAASDSK
ncbi:hypothetical protein PQR53_38120, partial [Paraburkholderia fungorum]|uniref:hypothetical protein n=1 Tax=Paraburkholderia fungorum TaxID=134537 RepID=UPI0038BD15EC